MELEKIKSQLNEAKIVAIIPIMSKKILIPTPLRPFVNQQEEINTEASNVDEALRDLATNFPKIQQHLYDKDDNLRKFINIYVNDSDIRDVDGVQTSLNDNDEISLVPAIAGGNQ